MKISYPSPVANLQAAAAVPQLLRGTVTFVAGTTGAIGQHTIFTITGMVKFDFYHRVLTDLTSGGAATISYGNAGAVTAILGATTATTHDVGDFSVPGAGTAVEAAAFGEASSPLYHTSTGTDITADILTATITGGSIEYILLWTPLSAGATVALGAELVAS